MAELDGTVDAVWGSYDIETADLTTSTAPFWRSQTTPGTATGTLTWEMLRRAFEQQIQYQRGVQWIRWDDVPEGLWEPTPEPMHPGLRVAEGL